jgi:hypothetical protein
MTHYEKASGWNSYDAIDCKAAKSLRYYKRKAHKKLRQILKKDRD